MSFSADTSPQDFVSSFQESSLQRGYIITLDQQTFISDPQLNDLKEWILSCPDFHGHEAIFFEIDPENECIHTAFVHNTHRGAGQGGTRFLSYKSLQNAFTDGMRLAEGMTYKNALAHLWWGGGKGVIIDYKTGRTKADSESVFQNYGKFVASLNGCYVTAEDMNTSTEDMRIIHVHCRHCTCIPADIGGSGNPSPFTARGVHKAMQAAIHFFEGKNSSLAGKHIAIQGAGHVGYPLLKIVLEEGAKVTVADTDPAALERVRNDFAEYDVTLLEPAQAETILSTACDIFAPCAIGAIISEETIPHMNTKMIAGAANNQLRNPIKDAAQLHEKGIIYLPDYVINRMGIVNCANEMYGYIQSDIEAAIEQVYTDTRHILEEAKARNITPFEYADIWAEEESMIDHPLWGHRGKKIIQELIQKKWQQGASF